MLALARDPACRRTGCGRPAGVDGLCQPHAGDQAARRSAAAAASRGRVGEDLIAALGRIIESRSEAWRAQASCRGVGPAAFFTADDSDRTDCRDEALAWCTACPVIEACRAAGQSEPAGVWGGITATGRRPRARPAA